MNVPQGRVGVARAGNCRAGIQVHLSPPEWCLIAEVSLGVSLQLVYAQGTAKLARIPSTTGLMFLT